MLVRVTSDVSAARSLPFVMHCFSGSGLVCRVNRSFRPVRVTKNQRTWSNPTALLMSKDGHKVPSTADACLNNVLIACHPNANDVRVSRESWSDGLLGPRVIVHSHVRFANKFHFVSNSLDLLNQKQNSTAQKVHKPPAQGQFPFDVRNWSVALDQQRSVVRQLRKVFRFSCSVVNFLS